MMVLIFLSLFDTAFADNWFCSSQGSSLNGSVMTVCGVGYGRSETFARDEALRNAVHEFETLCRLSSDCRTRETRVVPGRLTCDQRNDTWKCYRALAIEFGERREVSRASQEVWVETSSALLD